MFRTIFKQTANLVTVRIANRLTGVDHVNFSSDVQNEETVKEPKETVKKPWWVPASILKKRDYQSLTYDESNSIDLRGVSQSFDYHVPLSFHLETISKKDEEISKRDKEIGGLNKDLVAKDLLLKRVSVAYYLRTRMDRLQWTLTEDIDVRNELNHANVKVIIPPDISPDGQTSYRSRYRIWHAIMIVMQTKKNGFVAEVKAVFDTVGLPWQDPEMMASIFAKLFNHLSAEVKNNESDIDVEWENEEELLKICAKRSVQDPKELCAVKAIYRLKP